MPTRTGPPQRPAEGAQVDDYFGGSTVHQPATAPPAVHPPPVYPQPEAPPAYARAGWAPPAETAQPQQGWGPPNPYAPSPSSGPNKWLISVVVAVGSFLLIGLLAAVAIPVFLNQRAKAEAARTTVSAPETLLGMPHLTDAVSAAGEKRMLDLPGPGDHVAGYYGIGPSRVLVGAAHYHVSASDRRAFLDDATREAVGQGVTLREVSPGTLGGSMRCGDSTRIPLTLCVFVDGGSYGVIAVTGSDDGVSTARSAREAFVHRR